MYGKHIYNSKTLSTIYFTFYWILCFESLNNFVSGNNNFHLCDMIASTNIPDLVHTGSYKDGIVMLMEDYKKLRIHVIGVVLIVMIQVMLFKYH